MLVFYLCTYLKVSKRRSCKRLPDRPTGRSFTTRHLFDKTTRLYKFKISFVRTFIQWSTSTWIISEKIVFRVISKSLTVSLHSVCLCGFKIVHPCWGTTWFREVTFIRYTRVCRTRQAERNPSYLSPAYRNLNLNRPF